MPVPESYSSLFDTLIQTRRLPDGLTPGDLEAACWMIEDGDHAGREWCLSQGYPGYTSYASLNDLPDRNPAFADLVGALNVMAKDFATAMFWQMGSGRLVCDSLWINILGEGGHHSGHVHPNSVISGTCYVAMPASAGALKLEDPRLAMMMAAPPVAPEAPTQRQRFHYIEPQPGEVLMWESWLRHEVMPNGSEDARISISFNYALVD